MHCLNFVDSRQNQLSSNRKAAQQNGGLATRESERERGREREEEEECRSRASEMSFNFLNGNSRMKHTIIDDRLVQITCIRAVVIVN
jgi:hypothetical protein